MIKNIKYYIVFLLMVSCLLSCGDEAGKVFTYKVEKGEFSDYIKTDGTVEARNSVNITCPYVWSATIIYLVKEGSRIKKGDTVCVLEDHEIEKEYDENNKNYEYYRGEYKKKAADLDLKEAMLIAKVKNNEVQSQIAEMDSLQLKYSSKSQRKIKKLRLQINEIEKNRLRRELKSQKIINGQELKKLELTLKRYKNRRDLMGKRLKDLVLVAPKNGIAIRGMSVISREKIKEGEYVYDRVVILKIPDTSSVNVHIMATETEVKRIKKGQRVEYSFDGMPGYSAYGKIESKSPVGVPVKKKSEVKYFDVIATVDSVSKLPAVGLSASCRIYIGIEKDTISVPNVAVFKNDSINYIYVKDKNKFSRRQVVTGIQSSERTLIEKGLKEGDEIALVKPKGKMIKKAIEYLPPSDTLKIKN